MERERDDSRISAVGRKRNFEETEDQQQPLFLDSVPEDNAQRYTKRAKGVVDPSEDVAAADRTVGNNTRASSPPSSETSQVQPSLAAPHRTGAWNRVVQSGLRTSFANRVHAKAKPTTSSIEDQDVNALLGRDADSHESVTADNDGEGLVMVGNMELKDKQSSSIFNQKSEDINLTEQTIQAEEQPSSTVDHGEEGIALAEPIGPIEQEALAASEQIERDEPSAFTKPIPQNEVAVSSGEEEGEIRSLRGVEDNPDMPNEQPSKKFAKIEGVEGLSAKGREGITDLSHLQKLSHHSGDARRSAGDTVNMAHADLGRSSPPLSSKYKVPNDTEIETKALPHDYTPLSSFKVLSHAEQAQLPVKEKNHYKDALRRHRKDIQIKERIEELERRTRAAEAVFVNEVLPLKSQHESVDTDIAFGLTYFPKGVSETIQTYSRGGVVFKLSQVMNDRRPIRVQNFNFNIFAVDFLKQNWKLWHYITKEKLSAAFNVYINMYYNHCMTMGSWKDVLTRSVSDKDALSVEEAKHIATDGLLKSRSGATFSAVEEAQNTSTENPVPPQSMSDEPAHSGTPVNIPHNESMEIDVDLVDIAPMERVLQQKYFPPTVDHPATYHCLACGDSCHMTIDCPSLTCTLCGGADHAQSTCPQYQRCRKCRQRGHLTIECPEKLALSKAEAVGCDFCGFTDHYERDCHFIWRTFNPRLGEVRKVQDISVNCYSCGADGHYGPECGLNTGRVLSGGQTFSKANFLKYVDASSADRAVSAGIDYSIASRPRKQFSIKGMASDPIDVDVSDDEDISFISKKVKKPKQRGQITIAPSRSRKSLQGADFAHPRSPPREPRSEYGRRSGGRFPPGVESARYGGERMFSPPPRLDDMRSDFRELDQYRPQTLQRENFYQSRGQQAQTNIQSSSQGSLPLRPPPLSSSYAARGGGNSGRGGRGGGNRGGSEKRSKKIKGANRGGGATSKPTGLGQLASGIRTRSMH